MATPVGDYAAALERARVQAAPDLRQAALQVLAQHALGPSIRWIHEAVADPDARVRATAIGALGHVAVRRAADQGEAADTAVTQAVSVLTALLGSEPNARARGSAVWALVEIAERKPVLTPEQTATLTRCLATTLRGDTDVHVRQFAAIGLSHLGTAASAESLLVGLEDVQDSVRSVTLRALPRCGQPIPIAPLLRALEEQRGYLRAEAVRALAALGEGVPLSVLESRLQDPDEAVRVAAAHALLQRGREIDPILLFRGLTNHTSWEVRREAGDALVLLVQRGAADARTRLIALASTPGPAWPTSGWNVRDAAIEALGGLGDAMPVAVLLELLPELPLRVLSALRRAGQPVARQAASAIRGLLDHPQIPARLGAARALVDLGKGAPGDTLDSDLAAAITAVVVPVVLGVAATGDDYDAAVQLLPYLGPWVPPLILVGLLAERDEDVRGEAITALQVGHPDLFAGAVAEASAVLSGEQPGPFFSPLLLCSVARALGQLPPDAQDAAKAIGTLTSLLDGPAPAVQMEATRALGHFRQAVPEATRTRLAGLLQDSNRWVRAAAERALQHVMESDT
jgi:HEAT repeat protein